MANVCDYVKWRGDLNLKKDVFNEIDGLILSRLSYFPLEQLLEERDASKREAVLQYIIFS